MFKISSLLLSLKHCRVYISFVVSLLVHIIVIGVVDNDSNNNNQKHTNLGQYHRLYISTVITDSKPFIDTNTNQKSNTVQQPNATVTQAAAPKIAKKTKREAHANAVKIHIPDQTKNQDDSKDNPTDKTPAVPLKHASEKNEISDNFNQNKNKTVVKHVIEQFRDHDNNRLALNNNDMVKTNASADFLTEALYSDQSSIKQIKSYNSEKSLLHTLLLPELLKSNQPIYPEDARWEGRIGKVTLKFHITQRGYVKDAQVQSTSGHDDLDHAALTSLSQWRFDVTKDQPLDEWYLYSFRFELN